VAIVGRIYRDTLLEAIDADRKAVPAADDRGR
jgi:hypothetical protein